MIIIHPAHYNMTNATLFNSDSDIDWNYGLLYNRYAIDTEISEHRLAPNGWSVGTWEMWKYLLYRSSYNLLGTLSSSKRGKYLRSARQFELNTVANKAIWNTPPHSGVGGNPSGWLKYWHDNAKYIYNPLYDNYYDGTDRIDFYAIGAGHRTSDGRYAPIGTYVRYRCRYINEGTPNRISTAMNNNEATIIYPSVENDGCSVRLLRWKTGADRGTVTDYDGNTYYYYTDGDIQYTTSNFKCKHFANGDPISFLKSTSDWIDASHRIIRPTIVNGSLQSRLTQKSGYCYPQNPGADWYIKKYGRNITAFGNL